MLPEISLTILDIAQNSITAKASDIFISVENNLYRNRLIFTIRDNGCGMEKDQLKAAIDPFYTTRATRKVGLGIPFLKQSAEITGGTFEIESKPGRGTRMQAVYHTDSIDCMPLGNIAETIYTLVVFNDSIHFLFHYQVNSEYYELDTNQIRDIVGDVSFENQQISQFILSYLRENTEETDQRAKEKEHGGKE